MNNPNISDGCPAKPKDGNEMCLVYNIRLRDCCWLCSRWPKRFIKAKEVMKKRRNNK